MYQHSLILHAFFLPSVICQTLTDLNGQAAYSSELALDKSELAAATSSTLNPYQNSVLQSALSSMENNLNPFLNSVLKTQVPESVYTAYGSLGYSSFGAEFGSSFTDQSWYPYVENVHTQVQNGIITIEAALLTLTSSVSVAPVSSSTIRSTDSVGSTFTIIRPTLSPSTVLEVASTSSTATIVSSTGTVKSPNASRHRSLGLGLGFLFIFLTGVAAFLIKRHRSATARSSLSSEKIDHLDGPPRAELDGSYASTKLDGVSRKRPELDGSSPLRELEAMPRAVELA